MKQLKLIFCMAFLFVITFSSETWPRTDKTDRIKCFVVLESPAVFQKQKALSGGQAIHTAQFKAKRAKADAYAKVLRSEQDRMANRIRQVDSRAGILRRFTHLVNALTVEVNPGTLHELNSLPGVRYVAPVRQVKPCLTNSSELMHLPNAWQSLENGKTAGEGILIGVIDTGIDVTHPAFDDEGFTPPEGFPKGETAFTNGKIIVARVFPPSIGDRGDTTPFDRQGHGTNVASIAAGNLDVESPLGLISGVAPQAYLGNYKVFTNTEGAENDQIIAAIEQAVIDGVDVINLSLGSDIFGDPYHDLQILAIRNAIDLGVVVVIAAGNGGSSNPMTVGNPAQVDDAITVGSITNSHHKSGAIDPWELFVTVIVDGETVVENIDVTFGSGGTSFTEPILGTFPLTDVDLFDGGGYGSDKDGIACDPLDLQQPFDRWVLAQRDQDECTFTEKVNYIEEAGGTGVLFFDDSGHSGDLPTVIGTTIPSMMIDQDTGNLIKDAILDSGNVQIKISGGQISDRRITPDELSLFSSIGPSVGYTLKPDVVTVGEGSFAATQNDDTVEVSVPGFAASGFAWLSGTSMASPRVAGVAAMLKQIHPDWPPAWIKSAMTVSTHRPVGLPGNPERDANLLERGSGIVDAAEAMNADTVILPSMIDFGVHQWPEDETISRRLTVINPLDQPCDYSLHVISSEQNLLPNIPLEQFALNAGEKIELNVTLVLTGDVSNGDREGDFIVTNLTTGVSSKVPYWFRIQQKETPIGTVLLVDNDDGEWYENYYMDRLEAIGTDYTWWSVRSNGEFPSLDYMKQFKTVFWFLSETSLNTIEDEDTDEYTRMFNPRHLFEMDLMKYLTEGGSLFLTGMDYFDDKFTAAFSQEILRVKLRRHDGGASTIQGRDNHPVTDGLGPFVLDFPEDYDDFVDHLAPIYPPESSGETVLPAFSADGRISRITGVSIDTASYRALFLAFPLELLEPDASQSIVRKGLEWLQGKDFVPVQVTGIAPNEVRLSETDEDIPITISGRSLTFFNGYRAYLDSIPILELWRDDNETLTGKVPAGIKPGTYSLRVVTGDGHQLRLDHSFKVLEKATRITDWQCY